MTPWTLALQWQQEHDPQRPLADTVLWHLQNGYVHAIPTCLCLFSECRWDGQVATWEGEPNAYFVYLACRTDGTSLLGQLLRLAPRPQPWVLWSRNNNGVKAHEFQKLIRRI
jgi:hypothetical protein